MKISKDTAEMKKTLIIRTLAAAATALTVFSCQKEIEPAIKADATKLVTITASMPEDTKIAFEEGEACLSTTWQEGDKITVIGNTTEVYTLTSGAGSKTAAFTGNAVEGDSFTVICSGNCASASEFNAVSYAGQVQNGNGNTGHLRFGATLSGVTDYSNISFSSDWASANGATLSINGVYKFYLKLPAGTAGVSEVRINAPTAIFNLTNNGSSVSEIGTALQNCDVSTTDQILTAYAMASAKSASAAAGTVFTVTVVKTDGNSLVKHFTVAEASTLGGGKTHTVKLNDANWHAMSGNGVESAPFILSDSGDMNEIASLLVTNGPVRHFRMDSDIDMSGIHWTPLVTGNLCKPLLFDGDSHVINNLKVDTDVSFPSFAGVLDGTVKNVTFNKADVKNMKETAQQTAVVAAWAGRNNGDITATMQNVTIKDSKVYNITTAASAHIAGLFAGQANGLTADHCQASGANTVDAGINGKDNNAGGFVGYVYAGTAKANSFTDCSCNATVTVYGRVGGGFAGSIQQPATLTRCSSSGTLSAPGGGQFGGLAGALKGKGTGLKITDCSSSVAITTAASSGNHAGLIGYIEGAGNVISGCSASGAITSPCSTSAGTSGLIGGIKGTNNKITGCHSTCDITSNSNNGNIGGIVGYLDATSTGTVIEKCWYDGDIVATNGGNGASNNGGIVGNCLTAASGGLLIENCWSAGSITKTNYGIGGILGNTATYQTVSKCYSTMTLESRHGVGGIIGRADKATNAVATTYNITVEHCIFWGAITSRMGIGSGNLSTGAIVGKSATNNIFTNCWRKPGMTFTNYSDTQYNVLFDMPDTDAGHALDFSASTANPQSLGQYYYPYHGKAAAAGKTISDVAAEIGWSSSVWSFEHDEPELL